MRSLPAYAALLLAAVALAPCGCASASSDAKEEARPLTQGLLLALSEFEVSPEGKVLPKPKAAVVEILTRRGTEWQVERLEDPTSNVFHKAMPYAPGAGHAPGILTLGGSAAVLKLWRRGPSGFTAETLWQEDFGGKFSRMREAELLPMASGAQALAVATHDQGVVAIVSPEADGFKVRRLDQKPNTFVHEIEVGDL